MRVCDIMTQEVISVQPTATVTDAIGLMTRHGISGLPVINDAGTLVGIITEGDFLRRAELGTEKRRSKWFEFIAGPNFVAANYIHSHTRKVSEVMSQNVLTVDEDTPLQEVVRIMETNGIKRLPVMRGALVVGIVSRANLIRALAAIAPERAANTSDAAIRQAILSEIKDRLHLVGQCDVIVKDGIVHLWGTTYGNPDAIRVAAENVPGVKEVRSNLAWIEPYSGTFMDYPAGAAGSPLASAGR